MMNPISTIDKGVYEKKRDEVLQAAIAFDAGDAKRIQHLIKVYTYAALIGRGEQLPEATQQMLELAAILHDIGIHAAEEKYGSPAGIYQEKEGPAPARELLHKVSGIPEEMVERIAYLIGHHHTYKNVDGADYQILLEADFLVNAYEDNLSEKALLSFREKVFRTQSGTKLLNTIYGLNLPR
ncbi:HD domain-containing protein [Mitsuokella sp.]|uniref:HD domain-containing protein n=1 Tax=Mitsuokella sp. TaxID=2049034 RepID=UPI003D7E6199